MDSQERTPSAPPVAQDADSAQIVSSTVTTWQKIDAALCPIIGRGGVAALYKRSLYLTAPRYRWLGNANAGTRTTIDLTALQALLEQQSSADAAAASNALLQTFHTLLASLIGPALTERLLRPVWVASSYDIPAQDTSP
jgi:hypothetical protein